MAESPVTEEKTPAQAFAPVPWWCEYKFKVSATEEGHGYAIGWLHEEASDDKAICLAPIWYRNFPKGTTPEPTEPYRESLSYRIFRSDIIREGPMLMGQKMTKEEYEAYQAQQQSLAEAAAAYADECKSGERRSAEYAEKVAQMPNEIIAEVPFIPADAEAAETRPDHDWGV